MSKVEPDSPFPRSRLCLLHFLMILVNVPVQIHREIADYKAEAIRVIRGESKFSAELLNTLIEQAKEEESKLAVSYEEAQAEIAELSRGMEKEQEEYDRLISWAEIYSVCPFETKKMFISQFVKSVRVYRDYELEIEFNVSFEEFRDLRVRE